MNYNKLSRNGLIDLCIEYDNISDGALNKFADKQDLIVPYERIRPYEKIANKFENLIKESSDKAFDYLAKKVDDLMKEVCDDVTQF